MSDVYKQVNITVTATIGGKEKTYVISQTEDGLLLFSIRGAESSEHEHAVEIATEDIFLILGRMLWFGIYPVSVNDFLESQLIESAIVAKSQYGVEASGIVVDLVVSISDGKGTKTYTVFCHNGKHYSSLSGRIGVPVATDRIPCIACVLLVIGAYPDAPILSKDNIQPCMKKLA
ncbi:MAG: hypothetical protein WCL23_02950 [Candidatus Moraniibacteriota bacterium]